MPAVALSRARWRWRPLRRLLASQSPARPLSTSQSHPQRRRPGPVRQLGLARPSALELAGSHPRRHSVIATQRVAVDEVRVQCRSHGHVQLRIHRPPADATAAARPIVLYLPAGPVRRAAVSTPHDDHVAAKLSAAADAVVVAVHYRLGRAHPYPTPVHDVLTAYDWVLANLVHSPADPGSPPSSSSSASPTSTRRRPARLGVCGELVGGGLATMLALTECRMGSDRIAAAAVNNPIVDWVFPEPHVSSPTPSAQSSKSLKDGTTPRPSTSPKNPNPTTSPSKTKPPQSFHAHSTHPSLPASALIDTRTAVFPSLASCLDRFASPIHFLRSPSVALAYGANDDEAAMMGFGPEDRDRDRDSGAEAEGEAFAGFGSSSEPSSISSPASPPVSDSSTPRPWDQQNLQFHPHRRAHRTYPPTGLGLRLPALSVSLGHENVLRDQGEELVRLVRRSILRTEGDEAGRKVPLDEEVGGGVGGWSSGVAEAAAQKVGLVVRPGAGLWTGEAREEDWEREVGEVGAWFGGALRL